MRSEERFILYFCVGLSHHTWFLIFSHWWLDLTMTLRQVNQQILLLDIINAYYTLHIHTKSVFLHTLGDNFLFNKIWTMSAPDQFYGNDQFSKYWMKYWCSVFQSPTIKCLKATLYGNFQTRLLRILWLENLIVYILCLNFVQQKISV